jgi:hypothetical protein
VCRDDDGADAIAVSSRKTRVEEIAPRVNTLEHTLQHIWLAPLAQISTQICNVDGAN